jgi:hypothetical protein
MLHVGLVAENFKGGRFAASVVRIMSRSCVICTFVCFTRLSAPVTVCPGPPGMTGWKCKAATHDECAHTACYHGARADDTSAWRGPDRMLDSALLTCQVPSAQSAATDCGRDF